MSMDLSTTYMGLELKHPVVASPSPLSGTLDGILRLEDAGAAAVVMLSLFEEQVQQQTDTMMRIMGSGEDGFAECLSYFPDHDDYAMEPDQYLETLRRAAERCDIPVIASINGVTNQGWIYIARMMQQAGAGGLELNIYYIPTEMALSGRVGGLPVTVEDLLQAPHRLLLGDAGVGDPVEPALRQLLLLPRGERAPLGNPVVGAVGDQIEQILLGSYLPILPHQCRCQSGQGCAPHSANGT